MDGDTSETRYPGLDFRKWWQRKEEWEQHGDLTGTIRIQPFRGAGYAYLGNYAVIERFRVEADLDEHHVLRLVIQVDEKLGPLVRELAVRSTRAKGSITSSYLRGVKELDEIVEAAIERAAVYVDTLDPVTGDPVTDEDEDAGPTVAVQRLTARTRMSPAHLAEVAAVYRAALDRGDSPTLAVERHYGRPKQTVKRWVRTAREKGFLEPLEVDQ